MTIPLPPGGRWHPGPGAFLVPSGTSLRVVRSSTGDMIRDFGKITPGRKNFFIDLTDCRRSRNTPDPPRSAKGTAPSVALPSTTTAASSTSAGVRVAMLVGVALVAVLSSLGALALGTR